MHIHLAKQNSAERVSTCCKGDCDKEINSSRGHKIPKDFC